MKDFWENEIFWEVMGYVTLALCVIGQIAVGYIYIPAQIAYLAANVIGVIRDFAVQLPTANKVKDMVFTGITIGLIVIYFVH